MQQAVEVRVGLLVIGVVALALVAAGTLKGGFGGHARGYTFEIWFEQAPGVGKGSPVRLAGVDVGQVVDKDIVNVTETVTVRVAPDQGALPYEQVTSWVAGRPGDRGYVNLAVSTRRLAAGEVTPEKAYSRVRNVARLTVRVQNEFELFTHYRYQITGGALIGDKQLNITDTGADGLPLAAEERGESLRSQARAGRRVAVLGQAPPNLDAIVGNAQRIMDEETTVRVKQIIANIDRATEEAGEMLASLRAIIQANQTNADSLMTNLAAASSELKAGLSQGRAQLVSTLDHLERTTATAQRLVEANESHISHIVGQSDEAVTHLAAIAKDNQAGLKAIVDNAAALTKDAHAALADNRARIDDILASTASAAKNLSGITADNRAALTSMVSHMDASMAQIHELLRDEDTQLRSMIADGAGTMSDTRAMVGDLRTALPEITSKLSDAAGHVKDLTGDPALKHSLDNVEHLTDKANAMMDDIRRITSDPQLQQDVKGGVKALRHSAEALDKTVGGVSSLKPYGTVLNYYTPSLSRWESDVRLAILTKGAYSLHLGLDNVTNKPTWDVQLARAIMANKMMLRYGFYRGKLGVGMDFDPWPKARLQADLYNPSHVYLNSRFTYELPYSLTALVGADDMTGRFDLLFGLQVGHAWR
jgi:ABC-type transporter Mla subunit MlaD